MRTIGTTRRSGLGDAFADAIAEVLQRIGSMPRLHGKVFGEVRKAVVRGYPYCVYYREEASQIRVIAVFHTSRDPKEWQDRVEE